MIIVFLLVWIAFCAIVGTIASGKGRSFGSFFVLSILLSPLIGFIAVLFARSRDQLIAKGVEVEGAKKCPFCAEVVRAEAIKCKHCGSELPAEETTIEDMGAKRQPQPPMTRDEYERAYRIGKYAS